MSALPFVDWLDLTDEDAHAKYLAEHERAERLLEAANLLSSELDGVRNPTYGPSEGQRKLREAVCGACGGSGIVSEAAHHPACDGSCSKCPVEDAGQCHKCVNKETS